MSLSSRLAIVVALALVPGTGRADDKAQCIAAAESGQDLRAEGKLRAAREKLVACVAATCPDAIRKDCTKFLADVEASLPSIVVTATGKDGRDLYEVRLLVDGVLAATKLDGKAIVVDPGPHKIRVEADGSSQEVDVVLGEGDKNRKVTIAFPRDEKPVTKPAPESAERSYLAPIVVGGLGVAVLAGSLYLGLSARSDIKEMRGSCAPNCDEDALDRNRRNLLIADIGLGVGTIAVAVATYLVVATPSKPSTSVGARYVPSGGLLTFQTVF